MHVQLATRPTSVGILAAVLFLFGLFAFLGSLFMWGEGFLLSFPPGADYQFPVTDILVNAPASLLANWVAEVARFAPSLRAIVAHPSAAPAEK